MNIVIPMAGLGSRFSQSGFSLPKPLINVADKPMYRHAVECLPLELANQLVFIVREDRFYETLEKDILKNYSHLPLVIVKLAHETEGQADTILQGSHYLNPNQPILIHNCDTYVQGDFDWAGLQTQNIDGAIVLFSSQETRWSYAKLDKNDQLIIDVQEKKVISNHATTGTYFFKNTKELLQIIQSNIEENKRQNGEFYLSTVYQSMLEGNKIILPLWTKKMLCFGTPSDLVDSLNELLLQARA
ncbi:glycosyltransferase family 2 protein [Legionella fairfieldensis]|uniref:glycosyltransferase family 2 protein n=1 Tax=Legionella fairfieldensis TaxID=45064 RepID=UPI00048E6E5C|nr:glycosyltransferase family 2 protein [Legionella fairfieldensis]